MPLLRKGKEVSYDSSSRRGRSTKSLPKRRQNLQQGKKKNFLIKGGILRQIKGKLVYLKGGDVTERPFTKKGHISVVSEGARSRWSWNGLN